MNILKFSIHNFYYFSYKLISISHENFTERNRNAQHRIVSLINGNVFESFGSVLSPIYLQFIYVGLPESCTVTITRRLTHFTESKLLLFPLSYFIHYTMASRYALYYTATTIILLFAFSHKYSHIMPFL